MLPNDCCSMHLVHQIPVLVHHQPVTGPEQATACTLCLHSSSTSARTCTKQALCMSGSAACCGRKRPSADSAKACMGAAACCECLPASPAQDGPPACWECPGQMSRAAWGKCTGLLLVALLVLFLLLTLVPHDSQATEPAHTSCTLESGLKGAPAGHCPLCSSWHANDMRMLQGTSGCLRHGSLPGVSG